MIYLRLLLKIIQKTDFWVFLISLLHIYSVIWHCWARHRCCGYTCKIVDKIMFISSERISCSDMLLTEFDLCRPSNWSVTICHEKLLSWMTLFDNCRMKYACLTRTKSKVSNELLIVKLIANCVESYNLCSVYSVSFKQQL